MQPFVGGVAGEPSLGAVGFVDNVVLTLVDNASDTCLELADEQETALDVCLEVSQCGGREMLLRVLEDVGRCEEFAAVMIQVMSTTKKKNNTFGTVLASFIQKKQKQLAHYM